MLGGPLVHAATQSIRHHWYCPVSPTFPHAIAPLLHLLTVPSKQDVHAGKNLQAQYERWQPRAKYKMHLDPTMDDVKKLAVSSRRAAKVGTLSLVPTAQAQALHIALMHMHFIQSGHYVVMHLRMHLLIPLHPDAIACRLDDCTSIPPACILICTAVLRNSAHAFTAAA